MFTAPPLAACGSTGGSGSGATAAAPATPAPSAAALVTAAPVTTAAAAPAPSAAPVTTAPPVTSAAGPATGQPVKIGFVNLEGGAVSLPELRIGAQTAASYLNQHGGVKGRPLEIV